MQKHFFIRAISFVCFFSFSSYAQTDVGSWITYQNALELSRNLNLETELQLRSYNLNLENDETLVTLGLTKELRRIPVFVSAGFRRLDTSSFSENGIYQKAFITTTLGNFEYTGKLMLEQRWLNKNYQLRYRVGSEFSYDITSNIKLLISEEVFLSYTAGGFSQNRLIMKASYTASEKFKITTGLMHWKFQETTRWSILLSLKHALSL
jgi:hypothetical protein